MGQFVQLVVGDENALPATQYSQLLDAKDSANIPAVHDSAQKKKRKGGNGGGRGGRGGRTTTIIPVSQ